VKKQKKQNTPLSPKKKGGKNKAKTKS